MFNTPDSQYDVKNGQYTEQSTATDPRQIERLNRSGIAGVQFGNVPSFVGRPINSYLLDGRIFGELATALGSRIAGFATNQVLTAEQRAKVRKFNGVFVDGTIYMLIPFENALRKLIGGVVGKIDLSANDLMAMAYGAAKLEYESKTSGVNTENATLESRVKSAIADLVSRVRADKTLKESIDIIPVAPEAVAEAAAHGLDIEGYTHSIDSSAVNHVINRHGDAKTEANRGQIGITDSDFSAIADVANNPDAVVYGTKAPNGREQVVSIKRLGDGTLMVLEDQRTGKNKLALTSMRRYPAAKDFSSIAKTLLSNARSYGGNAFSILENPEPPNSTILYLFLH